MVLHVTPSKFTRSTIKLYKDYINGDCVGEWKELTYSEEWCTLAKSSFNLDIRDTYNKYCKKAYIINYNK